MFSSYPCHVVLGSFEELRFGMITVVTVHHGSYAERCSETVRLTRSGFFSQVRKRNFSFLSLLNTLFMPQRT